MVDPPERDPLDLNDALTDAQRWAVVIACVLLAAAVGVGVWLYAGLPAGEAVEGAGAAVAAGE